MSCASGLRDAVTERWSRTERDEFAELVCVEPSWLDTEFAAIIEANFGASAFDPDVPAPSPPHRDIPPSRPGRRVCAPTGQASPAEVVRATPRIGACERSPPLHASADRRRVTIREEVVPTVSDSRLESAVDGRGDLSADRLARRLVTRSR